MSRMSKELALKIVKSVGQAHDHSSSKDDIEYAKQVIASITNEIGDSDESTKEHSVLDSLLLELKNGRNDSESNSASDLQAYRQGLSNAVEVPHSVQLGSVMRSLAPLSVIAGGVLLGNIIIIGAGIGLAISNKFVDGRLRNVQTLKSLKVYEMNHKFQSLDAETRSMFPQNKSFQIDKNGNIVLLAKMKMSYERVNPSTKNLERWIFLESHNGNPEQVIRCVVRKSGFFRVRSGVKFDVFEMNREKSILDEFDKSFNALSEMSKTTRAITS